MTQYVTDSKVRSRIYRWTAETDNLLNIVIIRKIKCFVYVNRHMGALAEYIYPAGKWVLVKEERKGQAKQRKRGRVEQHHRVGW